jgi:hypothetical protein
MTGKRDGLDGGDLALAQADAPDPVPAVAWRALGEAGPPDVAPVLASLQTWVRTNAGRGVDPLTFEEAIDAVRRNPTCAACRASLRGLVWTALKSPTPHVARRPEPDAAGRRYLEALQGVSGR